MTYDPTHPTVYFSIGQGVSAFGILLAFINLANPSRLFRWRLGWFRLSSAYAFFFVGFLFILVSTLIPVLPFKIFGVAGWPIFWEIAAGVFFAVGSLGLIICGSFSIKATKRNIERYFDQCYSIICRGDDKELGALAEEIAASATRVVAFAQKYDRLKAHFAKQGGREYVVPESTRWACKLLDLWSDRRFCNVIVTRCPMTAIDYFEAIKEARFYNSGGYAFVHQLIAESFADPNSLLHREERYRGLGLFHEFTETVFGDYNLVESNFRPLQATGYEHNVLRNVEKYNQCLLRAVRAYLDSGPYYGSTSSLWCGVDILAKSGSALVERLRKGDSPPNFREGPSWALHRVSQAFTDLVEMLKKYETKLPEYTFDETDKNGLHDDTIYGILARGIYEYFDGLTRVEGHDWDVRSAAIDVWMCLYSSSGGRESRTVLEIQKRLEVRLWAQVQTNLESRYGCYPMITRLLVGLVGLHEHPQASAGEKRVSERLLKMLREGFKRAAQLDEKRARELLPELCDYNKEKNEIVVKSPWGDNVVVFACD